MMSGMQDPTYREAIEGKLQNLKNDPELEKIMAEIETGGPAAMMKCAARMHRMQSVSISMVDDEIPCCVSALLLTGLCLLTRSTLLQVHQSDCASLATSWS